MAYGAMGPQPHQVGNQAYFRSGVLGKATLASYVGANFGGSGATFTAPVAGTYKFHLWGCGGAGSASNSVANAIANGGGGAGYTEITYDLKAGQTVQVTLSATPFTIYVNNSSTARQGSDAVLAISNGPTIRVTTGQNGNQGTGSAGGLGGVGSGGSLNLTGGTGGYGPNAGAGTAGGGDGGQPGGSGMNFNSQQAGGGGGGAGPSPLRPGSFGGNGNTNNPFLVGEGGGGVNTSAPGCTCVGTPARAEIVWIG